MRKLLVLPLCLFAAFAAHAADSVQLLNVSYDPTREFYQEYNVLFASWWKKQHGQDVHIQQSHGGSGMQARAVMEGLPADVVTLALAYDIDAIAKSGKLPLDWQKKLPDDSAPFTSTVVFLVRKGNPKHIHDWDDLVKDGIAVITPNPKASGGARWNYLAAWAYAMEKNGNDETMATDFMRRLFKNVPVLDSGARGATTTFAQRGIGDVLITWENEAHLAMQTLGTDKFEIVDPSISILAETPVAVVEQNAKQKGTLAVAEAYLKLLWSPEAQEIAAKHFYRPRDAGVAERYKGEFPPIRMKTVADFGGWETVQKKHFGDGGVFDRIYGQ